MDSAASAGAIAPGNKQLIINNNQQIMSVANLVFRDEHNPRNLCYCLRVDLGSSFDQTRDYNPQQHQSSDGQHPG
jgi:hypothetical protein